MPKYKTYKDYLKSEKWKDLKEKYRQERFRVEVYCERCTCTSQLEHHHWRYPKDWNHDTTNNLIVLCHNCHTYIHATGLINISEFIDKNEYLLILTMSYIRELRRSKE